MSIYDRGGGAIDFSSGIVYSMLCLRDDSYYAASSRLLDFKTDTGKSYMEIKYANSVL
jgi:hypothetical protein